MPRRLLAYLALLLLLLGALGVQVYRSQLQLAQTREQDQLLSVARLKVDQIAAWRRDRLADAEVLSANPVLMTGFRDWLNGTASPMVQADLMAVIEALRRHYGYRDYLLADATGRVRVASGQPSSATLEAHAQAALATVQRSRAPYLTELHTDSDYPYPHMGLVVPLSQGDAPAGALILLVDAQKTLYPLLQTWPVPSATAETLLVRREGDAALFLNELRHKPDAALRLRVPLTRADLPSTKAIMGARGVVEGRDYRGVPVLAAVFPVPDTPWFVVAKVDRLELYAGVRREAVLLGGGLLTLLALAGAVLGLVWQRTLQAARAEFSRRQQLILTEATDGLWDWNLQTGEDFHSARYQELLGYGPGELPDTAAGFEAIVHPDDLPRINAAQQAHFERREPYQVELRLRTKQGDYRWFVSRGQAEWDADGRPLRMAGFITDITERKALDTALQEAGQRYINLLRATKDAFWLIEAGSGRLLDVNAAAVSLSGYTREELLTLRVTDLDIDIQGTKFAAQVQQIRGAGWGLFESRHRRKDGQVIPVEISVIPEVGDHKILAFIRDISERKSLEAALVDLNAHLEQKVAERTAELAQRTADLARTSERLDLAMQVTSDGVWDCNMQTEKVYCNANYFAMLGYGPDELGDGLDAVFTDLLPPEEREAIVARISQRFAREGGHESEFRMRAKDGSYRWVYARGRLVERDAAGQPLRAIGTHVDITARKKAEEALQDLNATLEQRVAERTTQLAEAKAAAEAAARAKSEFLANMSHEIRTPMNAILGLTQILEREPLTPDQRDMLQKIGDSGAGLLHIINDILDFSKIEAGQLKVERCAFELSPVLNQLEALLTGSAAGKGLELRIEPPVGMAGPVIGDPLRIKQILLNLVSNAIKFTEQGTVTVGIRPLELTETAVRLRFEVGDTGLGIAPAALAKLFQPFTQADASTTRRFGGTGLGLSICKRLVELMGGTIGATSELGAGSTFWFELPFERTATVAAPAAEASVAPAGPRLQGLRVLAVDDNRINLFMLERALKLEGVSRVQLAADGQQALQILEADPQGFDCVLMDVQMPVMDGLTATRLIREQAELQTLPVIALTAGVMAEERERAEAAGVTGFLAKPLELGAMVTMLRPYAPEPAADPATVTASRELKEDDHNAA